MAEECVPQHVSESPSRFFTAENLAFERMSAEPGFSPAVPGSYPSVAKAREQRTEERIQVRQVTHVQASWTEQDRGGDGAFTLQLILDNGADEYILRPTGEDAEVLLTLFKRADSAMFDLERKVVIFNNLAIE